MEETGVNLLIENSTHRNMKNASYFYTAKEMIDFIEYAGHPLLHACWDTGHANVEGDQSEQLAVLGAHLYAVHINDNRGVLDEHILPFMGTINMNDVMYGLQKAGFSGPFTLESDSVLHPSDYWNGKRRVFLKDSRLAEPTLEMMRDVEKLAYDIAKHILKQYGLYES